MGDFKELYQYIDEHQEEYIALAQRYCRQPSIVATGEGMREMANILTQDFKEMGFDEVDVTETEPCSSSAGWPIIYGRMNGQNPNRTIGIYNHHDTQPVEPLDQWISGPFSAEIRDGRIWARGIVDNKGSTAAKLCAIKALQAVYGKVPLNVNFIIEGEEEAGSIHMPAYLKAHPDRVRSDAILMGAGSRAGSGEHQLYFGTKGLLYVQLSCTKAKIDAHSMFAPLIPSAAWRLVDALHSLIDFKTHRVLIDGFYDSVRPTTETENMWLSKITEDIYSYGKNFGADEYGGYYPEINDGNAWRRWLYEPWLNICGLTSGYQGDKTKTVLPMTASAKLDFRLVVGQDSHEVERQLRAHLDKHGFTDVVIDWSEHGNPAVRTDMDTPFAGILYQTSYEVSGIEPDMMPNGAGSSAHYAFYQYCPQPVVNCGGHGHDDSRGHAPNENCYVQNYVDAIKVYAGVMKRLANT